MYTSKPAEVLGVSKCENCQSSLKFKLSLVPIHFKKKNLKFLIQDIKYLKSDYTLCIALKAVHWSCMKAV